MDEKKSQERKKVSLEDLFTAYAEGEAMALNLVLKADVQGSLEPIRNSLQQIAVKDLSVDFVHEGVGTIAESDVMLATASSAIIIGFNVRPELKASQVADKEGIDIRLYNVIYEAIEDVKKMVRGTLLFKETIKSTDAKFEFDSYQRGFCATQ